MITNLNYSLKKIVYCMIRTVDIKNKIVKRVSSKERCHESCESIFTIYDSYGRQKWLTNGSLAICVTTDVTKLTKHAEIQIHIRIQNSHILNNQLYSISFVAFCPYHLWCQCL